MRTEYGVFWKKVGVFLEKKTFFIEIDKGGKFVE